MLFLLILSLQFSMTALTRAISGLCDYALRDAPIFVALSHPALTPITPPLARSPPPPLTGPHSHVQALPSMHRLTVATKGSLCNQHL